jgi:putative ABC transport system permease protein
LQSAREFWLGFGQPGEFQEAQRSRQSYMKQAHAEEAEGAARHRARSILVITQVALAVVLLAGAGLTMKSFWRAQQEPLNFDPTNLLTVGMALPEARYTEDEKQIAFYQQLLDRIRTLPNVEAAAIGTNIPFDDNEWDSNFHITGTPEIPRVRNHQPK